MLSRVFNACESVIFELLEYMGDLVLKYHEADRGFIPAQQFPNH